MTVWISQAALWLVQESQTGDTLIVRQVVSEPSVFERVTGIASALMTLALLVLTVALVPAAWNFRKSYKKVSQLLDQVYGDVHPLMRHASVIADDVNYITTSIRVDIQQVNRTIADGNERVRQALDLVERRLSEFNALLEVVQQEAEEVFLSTASTLRGVRGGAVEYRRGGVRDGADDMEWHDDLDEATQAEEENDGNDSSSTAEGDRPGPRIRPRGDRGGP